MKWCHTNPPFSLRVCHIYFRNYTQSQERAKVYARAHTRTCTAASPAVLLALSPWLLLGADLNEIICDRELRANTAVWEHLPLPPSMWFGVAEQMQPLGAKVQ